MKIAAIFALLFLAFAYNCEAQSDAPSCNPDANGMPDCSGLSDSSTTYRNNWDPTHYWICSNGQAEQVPCPTAYLYDPKTSQCIIWSEWQWENPCPQASS